MFKDLTNKRFGKLLVTSRAENDKYGNSRWNCTCDCGNKKTIVGYCLTTGITKSCGCLAKENHRRTHNQSDTKLFRVWQYMKGRCYNTNNTAYKYYGGRGICVCDEWKNSFESFQKWSIANGYSENLTIDRIDSDGNYSPDNCRWVDRKVQMRNRRNTLMFTINGITKDLATLCEEYEVPYERTRHRVVNLGWSIEDALTTPKLNRMGKPVKASLLD